MKLLVLAQTPPPVHGQSLAVQALLTHLRQLPDWEVHHVNLRVSRDAVDIGRWRTSKLFSALAACGQVWRLFLRHGRMYVYYVPAPAKRVTVYRDWIVLALVRPFARGMIFHWHAVGLGDWLKTGANPIERVLSRALLAGVDLSIAQAEVGRTDCELLHPRRCLIVRNGVGDPLPGFAGKRSFNHPCAVLFVGLGCREKGLFDALEGVALANAAEPGAFSFTAIGPFAGEADEQAFRRLCSELGPEYRHLGFVSESQRNAQLAAADIFCFPSYYPHEGQPAVLLEALAHDLPIVTTRWRGIPENLPERFVYFVELRSPSNIAQQLRAARDAGSPQGSLRRHFFDHFTRARHLQNMADALRTVVAPDQP